MSRHHLGFRDVDKTELWLTDHLLKNSGAVTGRLLHATRLTDLIYQSLSFEDVFYQTDCPQRPIHPEHLTVDLFTALFSPVLKRREASSVYLRERTFNGPVLESVIQDDRFDTLKKLCEDKELISFEAATAFVGALQEQLLHRPYTPSVPYLSVIHMLSEQAAKTVEDIQAVQTGSKTVSQEQLLRMYDRVRQKLSQQQALEKKLQEDALCYIQSIGDAINQALEAAVQCAVETNSILSAWGTESGDAKNIPTNRDLLQHVKNSQELMEIARSLGKYREIIANKRKNGYAYGLGEKYDLATGNDVTNCLASELALLGAPETEILFIRKYEQKRLLQYRKRTQVIKGKGDMIVLVDESSSTRQVAAWAKAFALAMLDIATKDKRRFAIVHFAAADKVKTTLFEPGRYRSEDVMDAAEHFWGGGTDFESPFREALTLMEQGYENADIIIITDGECTMSEAFCEELRTKLRSYNATVTGILLDKDGPCGKSLETFCDIIYHSKDIVEDEIAVRILNEKSA